MKFTTCRSAMYLGFLAAGLAGSGLVLGNTLRIITTGEDEPHVELEISEIDGEGLLIGADGSVTVFVTEPVQVGPPNSPPKCANRSRDLEGGLTTSWTLSSLCSDPDGDDLDIGSARIVSPPSTGSASIVNGSVRFVAPDGATGSTSFTYAISDSRGAESDPATISINYSEGSGDNGGTVGEEDIPAFCSESQYQPPSGLARSSNTYQRTNYVKSDNTVIGFPSSGQAEYRIERDHYMAAVFRTGPAGQLASFITEEFSGQNISGKVVSISECPGDFMSTVGSRCRAPRRTTDSAQALPTINIDVVNAAGDGQLGHCELKPNTQYFMNIVHGRSDAPSNQTCSYSFCSFGALIRSR